MARNLVAAFLIALGLIVSSFLMGGFYSSGASSDGTIIWRVNRFTGEVAACVPVGPREGCHRLPLAY
jgi:hypothetical protein